MKIFLTGQPRSGKSTILAKIIDILKKRGLKVGGFITPEIVVNRKRMGFEIVDIYSGKDGILAKLYTGIESGPRIGKYYIDVKDFERIALKALDFAINECDIVCVDEIGSMELFSERFKEKIEEILKSKKIVIAVLHRNFVGRYGKYGKVVYVTGENRDKLPEKVITLLNRV